MTKTPNTPLRVLFAGRKSAACTLLRWLLEQGVDVAGVLDDVKSPLSSNPSFPASSGIPLYSQEEADESVERGELNYDLGISFLYSRLLKGRVLHSPPLGFINFHPAPLPELKGVGGYNVALLERRTEYGVSAHYVDAQIDTGPIIEVMPVCIDPNLDTAETLEARCMVALAAQFRRVISAVIQGHALSTVPNGGGRYISRGDMEALKQILPGDDAEQKARAFWFPPYEGAWLLHGSQRVTVAPRCVLDALGQEKQKKEDEA